MEEAVPTPTAQVSAALAPEAEKNSTRRTTVSVSLQGRDLEILQKEQERLGEAFSLSKILREYATDFIRLRDEEMERPDAQGGKGFLLSYVEQMEARLAESMQRHSEELAVVGVLLHLIIAHLDAKARWDFATTPEGIERPTPDTLDKRYQVLMQHTVGGINGMGQATIVEAVLKALESRA
jgi:hypothetical protein